MTVFRILVLFLYCFNLYAIEFLNPSPASPKAYLFFAHGMNQNKSAYKTLYKYFYEKDIAVVAPVLPGHDSYENFGSVPDESFNELYHEIFTFIQRENKSALPVYFMGHSLGALGFITYTSSNPIKLDKTILLAPAFKIKYEALLKIIPDCLGIPSLAPKKYRAFNFTPGRAYKQLLRLKNNANVSYLPKDTIVYLSKKDELVHYKKTKSVFPNSIDFESNSKFPKHYLFLLANTSKDFQVLDELFGNLDSI